MTSSPQATDVAFRIFGPNIDPEAITAELGAIPDVTYRRGDPRRHNPRRTYEHGMWLLDSKLPRTEPLEVHLDSVLSLLEPKQSYISALSEHATVDFYCVLYEQHACELSAPILGRIAALGATLGIATYPELTLRDFFQSAFEKMRSLWFNPQRKMRLSI
jgi:Domain of unknown function (DUF4279)